MGQPGKKGRPHSFFLLCPVAGANVIAGDWDSAASPHRWDFLCSPSRCPLNLLKTFHPENVSFTTSLGLFTEPGFSILLCL